MYSPVWCNCCLFYGPSPRAMARQTPAPRATLRQNGKKIILLTCALRIEEEHEAPHRREDVEWVEVVVDRPQGGHRGDVVVHVVLQVLLPQEAEPF